MGRIIRDQGCLAFFAVLCLGMVGCMTLGVMTKREAVAIVDHAMNQAGFNKQDVGRDSTFSISVDRFKYRATEYEVVVDATHEQDQVDKIYRRGRKKGDRNIDIPWNAVTRVVIKSASPLYADASHQAVEFFFVNRELTGSLAEESFTIGGLTPTAPSDHDAIADLSLAIKVLAGIEPAAHDDYDHRRVYDYDNNPAWQNTTEAGMAPAAGAFSGSRAASSGTTNEVRPTNPSNPPRASSDDAEQELKKLRDLYDRGLITDDVYKERQLQILRSR
jgi:hypothetical protein